jgi:hypothetical protein
MEIIVIIILILLNGIFSMSEISLVSSKKNRLESASKKGSKGAKIALELASSPNRFLSTVTDYCRLYPLFHLSALNLKQYWLLLLLVLSHRSLVHQSEKQK